VENLSFGTITPQELLKHFEIIQENKKFNLDTEEIKISSELKNRFLALISEHEFELDRYLEEELKMLFIAPIINSISFSCNGVKPWFERALRFDFENISLSGKTDFMLAKGQIEPKNPFFFIQEYKKSIPNGDPKWQVVSEMIVAIESSDSKEMIGSYIFGQYWHFVMLKKDPNSKYTLAISQSYDSLKIDDLVLIYKNLQAVKSLYCKG